MAEKKIYLDPYHKNNLIFRELNIDDKFDVYRLYSDSKVMSLDRSEPIKDMVEAEEIIRAFHQFNQSHHSICWGIELKETKKIIGTCGFKKWDRSSHHAEIGGNISSEYWSRGYGTETLKFMIEYGFTKMQLNKIYGLTNVNNSNVFKLMTTHGFQQEGLLREHQRIGEKFDDVIVFSLLKRDYKS